MVATEAAGSTVIASALRYDGYGRTAAVAMPGGTVALDTRFSGALDLSPGRGVPWFVRIARRFAHLAGRPVNFMIYRSIADAVNRAPSILMP